MTDLDDSYRPVKRSTLGIALEILQRAACEARENETNGRFPGPYSSETLLKAASDMLYELTSPRGVILLSPAVRGADFLVEDVKGNLATVYAEILDGCLTGHMETTSHDGGFEGYSPVAALHSAHFEFLQKRGVFDS